MSEHDKELEERAETYVDITPGQPNWYAVKAGYIDGARSERERLQKLGEEFEKAVEDEGNKLIRELFYQDPIHGLSTRMVAAITLANKSGAYFATSILNAKHEKEVKDLRTLLAFERDAFGKRETELMKQVESLRAELKRERECVDFYAGNTNGKTMEIYFGDDGGKRARETQSQRSKS